MGVWRKPEADGAKYLFLGDATRKLLLHFSFAFVTMQACSAYHVPNKD